MHARCPRNLPSAGTRLMGHLLQFPQNVSHQAAQTCLLWRSNGGLTNASSHTAVSRSIESKPKTKKAPPRFAGCIAPRGEKQCADNFLQAKRRANEVRFILPSQSAGRRSSTHPDRRPKWWIIFGQRCRGIVI